MSEANPGPNAPSGNDSADGGVDLLPGRPGRRPTLWVLAGLLSALFLVVFLVARPFMGPAGPRTPDSAAPVLPGPTVVQEAPAAPGASAAPPVIPIPPRGEVGFVAEQSRAAGAADPDTIGVARQACSALESGGSRASIESAVIQTGRYDQKAATALVSSAVQNFCPDRATPAVKSIKDGIWQAGADVEPGRYVTSAGDGCAWQRSTSPDASSLAGIIDSGTGAGPKAVTLEAGQYLVTSRCGEWTRNR